jgi:hypothetical protein
MNEAIRDLREDRNLTVAFDLDGTIAEIHRPALERSGVSKETFKTKDFTPDEWKEYNHASSNLWHNHPEKIDVIPGSVDTLNTLYEAEWVERMDIVTHRTGQATQITDWLQYHGAQFDHFVPVPGMEDKGKLEYDVYLDDSPIEEAPEDSVVMVPARWYNEDVEGIRVDNYDEVRSHFGLTFHP